MRRAYVDLSHVIEDGLVTYPGLPAARICDYLSREQSREKYAPGTEFQIGSIEMVANTGTYIDCPFHRYAHGDDLSQIEPAAFADLDGIVVRADHRQVRAIDAVLVPRQGAARPRRARAHRLGRVLARRRAMPSSIRS